MITVNIHEAKTHLSALIQKVLDGEEVTIAKNNTPVISLHAIVNSLENRKPGILKGKIKYIGNWEDNDTEIENLLLNSEIISSHK